MHTLDPLLAEIVAPVVSPRFARMAAFIGQLQNRICSELAECADQEFVVEAWERPGGGGGLTRITGGRAIEKGGVNTSVVYGDLAPEAAAQMDVKPQPFAACGLSLVIHPFSPHIPSIHMNVRLFELADGDTWYGGGIDLTPYYPHADDCAEFHRKLRAACEPAVPGSYNTFKEACDRYFWLPHRKEMRGASGVFFDYLRGDLRRGTDLVESVGNCLLSALVPIVMRRHEEPYTDEDRAFQLFRRGRYVEFNLLYDRGTQFGLKTGGRVESILMSLPPHAAFPYDWAPPTGSIHAQMSAYYQPRDWIGGRQTAGTRPQVGRKEA